MSALDDTARLDWLQAQESYSLSNLGGGPHHHLYTSSGQSHGALDQVRTVRTATKRGLREVLDALRGEDPRPAHTDQVLTDIIEQALERAFDAGASNNTMPGWEGIEQLAIATAVEIREALSVPESAAGVTVTKARLYELTRSAGVVYSEDFINSDGWEFASWERGFNDAIRVVNQRIAAMFTAAREVQP